MFCLLEMAQYSMATILARPNAPFLSDSRILFMNQAQRGLMPTNPSEHRFRLWVSL
jgi:hypothetical protein